MKDAARNVSASRGVANSGRRVRRQEMSTGAPAAATSRPPTMRIPVPKVWPVAPFSSGQRGSTKKKKSSPAIKERAAWLLVRTMVAVRRPAAIALLDAVLQWRTCLGLT